MKRTRIHTVIELDNRYKQYRSLEVWLEEHYVHVVKVVEVDEDTLVVFYENA